MTWQTCLLVSVPCRNRGLSQTFSDQCASGVRRRDGLTFGYGSGFQTPVFLSIVVPIQVQQSATSFQIVRGKTLRQAQKCSLGRSPEMFPTTMSAKRPIFARWRKPRQLGGSKLACCRKPSNTNRSRAVNLSQLSRTSKTPAKVSAPPRPPRPPGRGWCWWCRRRRWCGALIGQQRGQAFVGAVEALP